MLGYGTGWALTSPDGINWTARAIGVTKNWYCCYWDGTNFIALSYGSTSAIYSADGITWTIGAAVTSLTYKVILQSGSRLVAICNTTGDTRYSTDHGVTWSVGTTITGGGGYQGAMSATAQLVVRSGSTTGYRSTDGFNTYAAITLQYAAYCVVYDTAHSRFVSVGTTGIVQYSTDDGITWLVGGALPGSGWDVENWSLQYGNGCLYAINNASNLIAVSADGGDTWASDTNLPSSHTWYGSVSSDGAIQIVTGGATVAVYRVGSGVGAATLGDITGAGAGTVTNRIAVGAATLDDITGAGAGTHYPPNVGSGAATLDDITGAGVGDSGALAGSGAATLDNVTGSGTGTIKNTGSGAATLESIVGAGAGTLPITVVEPWSLNVTHPTTGAALTGLGDAVVKWEAYQESTGLWFNPSTGALQTAQPTALALLEGVNGRYAANATITVFNLWMILHWYYDYDASDGRGSVRYHSWGRAYYNNGVEILPGLTAAQAFQLAEKPILSQIVGALPDVVAIVAAMRTRVVDGGVTGEIFDKTMLAFAAGKRRGLVSGTAIPVLEELLRQDGITPQISFSPTDVPGNGTPVINSAP